MSTWYTFDRSRSCAVYMEQGRAEILVVDSAAFIKRYQLHKYCKKAVTVKEVVAEIRDLQTRQSLQVLPYELELKEPDHASVAHVSAFSKKTGDYGVLSSTDVKVLALAYELECQLGVERGKNLRTAPLQQVYSSDKWVPVKLPGVVGGATCPRPHNTSELHSAEAARIAEAHQAHQDEQTCCGSNSAPDQCKRAAEGPVLTTQGRQEWEEGEVMLQYEHSTKQAGDVEESVSGISVEDSLPEPGGNIEQGHAVDYCDGGSDSDEVDDDEGWITPDNIDQARIEMGGCVGEELGDIRVGCMTTDFAMQNVLLQIGLNLISPDGMVIKEVRTYVLQCKACFKTTSNMSLLFCPCCGYKTLIRVVATVDAEGRRHLRALSQKQFSKRGLKYSLPKPKGGRHANNPIIIPDQKVTYCQPRKRASKVDVFSPDYTALSSPFAAHDVTSRGANMAFARGSLVRPRNPNEVRRKGRRKK